MLVKTISPEAAQFDSFIVSRDTLLQFISLPDDALGITRAHFQHQLAGSEYILWPSTPFDLLADRHYAWPLDAVIEFGDHEQLFNGTMTLATDTNQARIALFNHQDSLILSLPISALYRAGFQSTPAEMHWRTLRYQSVTMIGALRAHDPVIWGQFYNLTPDESAPRSGSFTNIRWPEETAQPN